MEPTLPVGNYELLYHKNKTGFLTSRNTPASCLQAIYDWVDGLSPKEDCVICGAMMNLERDVLIRVLKRRVPLIVVFDEEMPATWDTMVLDAVAEGRFAALTTKEFPLIKDKIGLAWSRNQCIVSNCESLVVGFLAPGGKIASLVQGMANVKVLA